MPRSEIGAKTESIVKKRLRLIGLSAIKPIPDVGVDIETFFPEKPNKKIRIQVKGRDPEKVPDLRWFQIPITAKKLIDAKKNGIGDPNQLWKNEVKKVEFFIFCAVKVGEIWTFPRDKIYELIYDNEEYYVHNRLKRRKKPRNDNIFVYESPQRQKQKEMNLGINVDGIDLIEKYKEFRATFQLTNESIDKLQHRYNIPIHITKRIKQLNGIIFTSEKEFITNIEEKIGNKYACMCKSSLLKNEYMRNFKLILDKLNQPLPIKTC